VLETFRQQKIVQVDQPTGVTPVAQPAYFPSAFTHIAQSAPPERQVEPVRPRTNPLKVDWVTIALGLLALIAVGGLIPFFLWVYFTYNPPIR
jgi:hypothetical protein